MPAKESESENAPQTRSEDNLSGAAGRAAPKSAKGADEAVSEREDHRHRPVHYETLAQFASRNNTSVSRVRELNPDGVDHEGYITQDHLRVE